MDRTESRTLTPREAEVLELAAHGLSNGQLADRLGVTVHAIKFHLASIYRKLGVANRTEAAGLYFQHLAPLPEKAAQPLNGRRSDAEEERRLQALAAPPVLDLPMLGGRHEGGDPSQGHLKHDLAPALVAAVRWVAAERRARVESVFLAGVAALLHRYTQVDDVVLDSNLGPLWLDVAGDPGFVALVDRVEQEILHARQRPPDPTDSSVSSRLVVAIPGEDALCDLSLGLVESEQDLRIEASFDATRLEPAAVARLLGSLGTVLASGTAAPGAAVASLDLLSPDEQRLMLHTWNETGRPIPNCRADELIAQQAASRPADVAVEGEGGRLTYADLDSRANGLARLLQRHSVGAGSLVALCMERTPAMLVGLLGIMRSGGAYVPIDPAFPADRRRYMLENAGVRVIVTQESLLATVSGFEAEYVCLDRDAERIASEGDSPPPSSATADDLAYVIYTSGSTGQPKGVQIPHRALVNFLTTMQETPGMHAGDVLVAVTTLSFDIAGLELYLPLVAGGRVVIASQQDAADPRRLADLLRSSGATVLQATPTTWRMLVDSGWDGIPGLKALCGGEALPRVLAEQLVERGLELWNMYGPTESTIWSTVSRVHAGEPLTIGRPIANTSLYILDDELRPMPVGVPGELHIGGDGLARGYLGLPDLTAERFIGNPFADHPGARMYKTGDLARYRADGTVEFLGRRDHQVKVRGFRIELGEIETALARRPGVIAAVAVAREDIPGDVRLVAYVVLEPDAAETSSSLRRSLEDILPAYMVPSAIVPLDSLPLTPNGKIDRKALPVPTFERDTASTYRPARTELERSLVEIWESELGIEPLGIGDDFFDLGLTSVVAARLFARLERELGKTLPLGALFQAPTIERLAELIEAEPRDTRWTSLVPIQPSGSQPPIFCVHGGAGTILHLQPLARRLGTDQPFYGFQARGLYGGVPPHRTVEQMATHYLSELRMVQPTGPYYLAGYCFGSIVAFDMAQRLVHAGEDVNMLVAFNGPSPTWIRRYGSIGRQASMQEPTPRQQRSLTARVVGLLADPAKLRRLMAWRVTLLKRRFVNPIRMRRAMRLEAPLTETQRETFFLGIAARAQTAYEPQPYPGRMVVFYGDGLYEDRTLGWSGAVDWVETYAIPGPHQGNRTLMAEPAVGPLSDRMREVLTRARSGELRARLPSPARPPVALDAGASAPETSQI